jgi:diaminopimelate epimerase
MGSARDVGQHVTSFAGASVAFHRISTGNPHAIHFDSSYDLAQIDILGPQVSAELPEGSNVEFVTTRADGSLDLVVWERGVGRTLACGTGACATVVAAALARRIPFSEEVTVHLPGGSLKVAVAPGDLTMRMSGPAVFVFAGTW